MIEAVLSLNFPDKDASAIMLTDEDERNVMAFDMHVTLGVFDADFMDPTELLKSAADLAKVTEPVVVEMNGKGRFYNGDDGAFVALVDSATLYDLRDKCSGISTFDRTHGYRPHVTLKTGLSMDEQDPALVLTPGTVTLSEMILSVDERSYVFPLLGDTQEIPPNLHKTDGLNECKGCAAYKSAGICSRHIYELPDEGFVCDDYVFPNPGFDATEGLTDEAPALILLMAAHPIDAPVEKAIDKGWDMLHARKRVETYLGIAEALNEVAGKSDPLEQMKAVAGKMQDYYAVVGYNEHGVASYGLVVDVVTRDKEEELVIRPEAVKALLEGMRDEQWPDWINVEKRAEVKAFAQRCVLAILKDTMSAEDIEQVTFKAKALREGDLGLRPFSLELTYLDVLENGNALKAMSSSTDEELVVGNYLALWYGRDLEGTTTPQRNVDGTRGEFFTPGTEFESIVTRKSGMLPVDWEHRQDVKGPFDEVLGYVNWKSARIDDMGLWVERTLDRRNKYIALLDRLGWFAKGLLGTSSEPITKQVVKQADGEITSWPLKADTITVMPMEPRMMAGNALAELGKALEPKEFKELAESLGFDLSSVDIDLQKQATQARLRILIEQ